MRLSAKTDYACRALLELSVHWPNEEPLQMGNIAERQNIPMKFLTQIMISLKQLGYVESIRGKNGGYLLAKQPKDINLGDLVVHLGNIGFSQAEDKEFKNSQHIIDQVWNELDHLVLKKMKSINFEVICLRKKSKDKVVMYEI